MFGNSQGTFPGTTGPLFEQVAKTPAGRVGFRNIGGDQFRVRVEPASGVSLNLPRPTWKQPGDQGQNRHSTVVNGVLGLNQAVATASIALRAASQQAIVAAKAKFEAAQAAFAAAQREFQELEAAA